MTKIRPEDVVFWIIIAMIVAIIIWKLFGSPTDLATYASIFTLIATSQIVIWKHIYRIENKLDNKLHGLDKKTAISFVKMKHDIYDLRKDMNNRFDTINEKLDNLGRRKK